MIQKCLTTSDVLNSGRVSVFLMILTVMCLWKTGMSQPCAQSKSLLHWESVDWIDGQKNGKVHIYEAGGKDSMTILINVSTFARGAFRAYGVNTPYVDGGRESHFGTKHDLGIIFDPDHNQGHFPVLIDIRFSQPVSCLSFEISDIDASGRRRDSISITANGGKAFPKFAPKVDNPTMQISEHTAAAIGYPSGPARSGSSLQHENSGTMVVDFGSEIVEMVSIAYYEGSDDNDPGARGIGILGELVFDRVQMERLTILEYTIEKNEDCFPLLKLDTKFEYNLDEYMVEYSYDGLNYVEAFHFDAHNSYTQTNHYKQLIPRKLNNENYFRISGKTRFGDIQALEMVSISGTDCYNFTHVNIYPNPSYKDFFFVEIESSRSQETDIVVLDQSGRQVLKARHLLKKGSNWLKISSRTFAPGVYHVHFAAGNEIVSRKVSII